MKVGESLSRSIIDKQRLRFIFLIAFLTLPFLSSSLVVRPSPLEELSPPRAVHSLRNGDLDWQGRHDMHIFSERLGGAMLPLLLHLTLRDLDVDQLFTHYVPDFEIYVITDETMDILGNISGMESGLALNLGGFVFIRKSTLKEIRAGNKESLVVLIHEKKHNDYSTIHGYARGTIEQKLVDELYAFFSSFIEVYGIDHLSALRQSRFGDGIWAYVVLNTLVRDYLHEVNDEQRRKEVIEKLSYATSILNYSFVNYNDPKMIFAYLKTCINLDQILVMTSRDHFEKRGYSQTLPANFDLLQEQFKSFKSSYQQQANQVPSPIEKSSMFSMTDTSL